MQRPIWPSHGRYYDFGNKKGWKWQRPYTFCTTEDMFTRSIVVPFLIPMLEHSGAVVYSPRERDQNKEEIIVDNDTDDVVQRGIYVETNGAKPFGTCPLAGFEQVREIYSDGQNPHQEGSARVAVTTTNPAQQSVCQWIPSIPEDGDYALYVTYPTLPQSVDDAVYTVRHRNIETRIRVNQRMGGGTWVYLGTFSFAQGCNPSNSVSLSNCSTSQGVITADAIKLGGGMGNIEREGQTSGMPRFLEGARYYTQWAGMPHEVYNTKDGRNDYADDINARSNAMNYLAGGSVYLPDTIGLSVPMELSMAVHSDAGYRADNSVFGTLSIYTGKGDRNTWDLLSGVSRLACSDLAALVQDDVVRDLSHLLGRDWTRREIYNRNYSETRKPEVPSIILEMLSHQNFQDMLYGHDPNFKFMLSRAIYKAITRFVNTQHERDYTIQPLPVTHFMAEATDQGAHLEWKAQEDELEPTAKPTGYIIYIARENDDFDNGHLVEGTDNTRLNVILEKDVMYRFKVTACNAGGESFPSEVLSVVSGSEPKQRVLVVNGFTRLSSPAVISTPDSLGFDLDTDMGVPYINTAAFCGAQTGFLRSNIGSEEESGLGYSGSELEGEVIAGNNFDYPSVHVQAIQQSGSRCSVSSASMDAFADGLLAANSYQLVDIIFGLQKDCGISSIVKYHTFSQEVRDKIDLYLADGGSVFVSGAYIGSDLKDTDEQWFAAQSLNYCGGGSTKASSLKMGDRTIPFVNQRNARRYATTTVDITLPVGMAETLLTYPDGNTASVASHNTIVMGVPLEAVSTAEDRSYIMRQVISRLLLRM